MNQFCQNFLGKLTLIVLVLVNLLSCKAPQSVNSSEPILIITANIDQAVKPDITLPTPTFKADIQTLFSSEYSSELRMVAYGGSLMAGFRNGGLYREGQLTSVPQLIAHQMGLAGFVSPLFEREMGNGTGYLLYDQTASLPSWKQVTNQLGVISKTPYTLTKYLGPTPNNLSLPNGILPGAADSTIYRYFYPTQKQYYAYLNRLLSTQQEGKFPITYFLDLQKVDLMLYERDLDQWLGIASYPLQVANQIDIAFGGGTMYYAYEKDIKESLILGRKLVLFNQPDYLDFPFFHLYDTRKLKALGITSGITLEDSALLIPNDKIKRAFTKAGNSSIILEDQDIISKDEVDRLKGITLIHNTYGIHDVAKLNNVPLVDLNALYKKVLNRQYTTDDGFFIDPSFPKGNFFSSDGIYPSAIGSAVIANETIKTINQAYKTTIPLINLKEYAARL